MSASPATNFDLAIRALESAAYLAARAAPPLTPDQAAELLAPHRELVKRLGREAQPCD